MLWKSLLIIITGGTIYGAMTVENPKEYLYQAQEGINQAYYYCKESIQENTKQWIGSIITAIVTTIMWISVVIFLRKPSDIDQVIKTVNDVIKTNVIPKSGIDTVESNPILEKAQARALYNQLKQDLIILEGRKKWMPEQIEEIRDNLTQAKRNLVQANNAQKQCQEEYDQINNELVKLTRESCTQEDEIKNINIELERLKELI